MKQEIYFSLLTVCITLSAGTGALSEENIEESSKLHVRKKRVVNRFPNEPHTVTIQSTPYVVHIRRNGYYTCMGSILTANIILTNGECIDNPYMVYSVWSGSSYLNRGFRHKVVERYKHPGYRNRYANNLGILEISPPIDFHQSFNRKIELHNGTIAPNTRGTITGWGCCPEQRKVKTIPNELRSISVPIISESQCRFYCRNTTLITNKQICTLDRQVAKCAGYGDAGAPLVVDQQLVGVLAWSGGFLTGMHPDVFVNLSHHLFRDWINTFITHV